MSLFKTEYTIKTRHIHICDVSMNRNKKYTAQVVESVRINGNEEEIHGYVYVPRNQKIVKVSTRIYLFISL